MTHTPTEPDLSELGPLAAVIADTVHTVPVRLGVPGGEEDLVHALTLAVAVYVGRHVLPEEAAELLNPPAPAERAWRVMTQWRNGSWRTYGGPHGNREDAQEDYDGSVRQSPDRSFRLVRATTTHAVEAEHIAPPLS
ncbi:hypothetical protein ACIP9H_33420 [Streptomyces sp. NPDC088732]|uniref:hypothetical protein n=1 Tax=Streptomyces sp. NPDC088732 TaxID=3365879 RepID=UPI003810C2EB